MTNAWRWWLARPVGWLVSWLAKIKKNKQQKAPGNNYPPCHAKSMIDRDFLVNNKLWLVFPLATPYPLDKTCLFLAIWFFCNFLAIMCCHHQTPTITTKLWNHKSVRLPACCWHFARSFSRKMSYRPRDKLSNIPLSHIQRKKKKQLITD